MVSDSLVGFLRVFLIPLSWLPAPVVIALDLVIGAFALFTAGRIFKWIWDALPLA